MDCVVVLCLLFQKQADIPSWTTSEEGGGYLGMCYFLRGKSAQFSWMGKRIEKRQW